MIVLPNIFVFIGMNKKLKNVEIIKLFNGGKSCVEISKIFKCNPETIRLRLKQNDINTSKKKCNVKCYHCGSTTKKNGRGNNDKQKYKCLSCGKIFVEDIEEQYENMLKKHKEIKKMYLIGKLNTIDIGKILGVSSTIPQRILKKYGLTREMGYAKELGFANMLNLSHDEYISRLPIFKKYKRRVIRITNKQNLKNLEYFDKRGLAGIDGVYHLDHKYSIIEGFKNDVEPYIIGNIVNLEFIPWRDNIKKGGKCSITINELMVRVKTA